MLQKCSICIVTEFTKHNFTKIRSQSSPPKTVKLQTEEQILRKVAEPTTKHLAQRRVFPVVFTLLEFRLNVN
jgi:hypothetical protein